MARNRFVQPTPAVVALVAATLKTVLGLNAAAGVRVAITGISISFDGNSNVAVPVLVEVYRTTTAGTATANNPVPLDSDLTTALQLTGGTNYTVEPAKGARLASWLVHPQSGIPLPLPLPEGEIIIPGGLRIALVCTAPANVNCAAEIRGEE
jgi:hypothetical protein